jgi:hypothetical protein
VPTTVIDPETGEPVELPIPLPLGPNPPALPVPANPLYGVLPGNQQKWETVEKAAQSVFDKFTSTIEDVGSAVLGDVKTIAKTALSVSQTFLSTYISTLEAWTITGIDDLGTALDVVSGSFADQIIALLDLLEAAKADALGWVADAIIEAERYADRVLDDLAARVLGQLADVETWAIDNIYHPLLNDVEAAKADVLDTMVKGLSDVETYARDLVNAETLERLAAVGAIAAAIAAITTWIDDCGVPMCEEFGPGSQVGNLLQDANLLKWLELLAAIGALSDPTALGSLAVKLAETTGPAMDTFVADWLAPLQHATANWPN